MADYDKVKDENCRLLLLEKGFKKDMIVGSDEVWINTNNKSYENTYNTRSR